MPSRELAQMRLPLSGLDLSGCFVADPPRPMEMEAPARLGDLVLPSTIFSAPLATTATTTTVAQASLDRQQQDTRPGMESGPHKAIGPDPHLPPLGTVIDKYRLEALLGVGGFAAVYRATHLLLRTPVAIKLLQPGVVAKEPHLAHALCEEARFAAAITHRNVVRVLDATHSPQITYIVMEYIEGDSLATRITRSGVLPVEEVLRIAIDVCDGLQAALEQGMIHRDIKPGNILLAQGAAKIVDLGLARHYQEEGTAGKADASAASGAVAGTPAYLAPETVIHPDGADFRSDIYSLGATIYHALAGKPPFVGDDTINLLYQHQHAEVPDIRQVNPQCSAEVQRLIAWMLRKRPEQRPGSYLQLVLALEEAAASVRPARPRNNTRTVSRSSSAIMPSPVGTSGASGRGEAQRSPPGLVDRLKRKWLG